MTFSKKIGNYSRVSSSFFDITYGSDAKKVESSVVLRTSLAVPTLKTRRNSRFFYGSYIIPGIPPICGGIPPMSGAAVSSFGIS